MPGSAAALKALRKWRSAFEITATLVMIILAAVMVWQNRMSLVTSPAAAPRGIVAPPRDPIVIAGSPTLGAATAKVAIVEYADFQCNFCGVVAKDIEPRLRADYVDTGRVIIVFKHLPLSVHPLAARAAAAATCAHRQGKFWQMHDRLFAEPAMLGEQSLRGSAREVGLNLAMYDSCSAGAEAPKSVEADRVQALALGITGTPTFVFGRVEADGRIRATDVLSGAKPLASFTAVLNRLLD